jgi:hypothetical protein
MEMEQSAPWPLVRHSNELREVTMARKSKGRKRKTKNKAPRKSPRGSKRTTEVSVKSGKARATVNLKGIKPTGASIAYGDSGDERRPARRAS